MEALYIQDVMEVREGSICLFCSAAEKDVNRTDRTNRFYEGPNNPTLTVLHDILMTYCMYDFDLGEIFITSIIQHHDASDPSGPSEPGRPLLDSRGSVTHRPSMFLQGTFRG